MSARQGIFISSVQKELAPERRAGTKFRHQVIKPLMDQGLLEMTLPDKPTSSQQKCRVTAQGAAWLAAQTGKKQNERL